MFTAERLCESQCPRNCFESHYDYEIQTRKGDHFRMNHNEFSINLEHNRFPDQVIEHKPIMDWITLVSNWGGLLGMWMGLSVLYMCNKFLDQMFTRYSQSTLTHTVLPLTAKKWRNNQSVTLPSFRSANNDY